VDARNDGGDAGTAPGDQAAPGDETAPGDGRPGRRRSPGTAPGRAALVAVPVAAAVLWTLSGTLGVALTWHSLLPSSVTAVLPATLPFSPWVQPVGWGVAETVLAALVLAVVVRLVLPLADRSTDRTARFVVAWFAVVVAAAVAGLTVDLATIVGNLPAPRLRMVADGLGTQAATGAWWGLVQGWLPALLVRRAVAPAGSGAAASDAGSRSSRAAGAAGAAGAGRPRRRTARLGTVLVAVVAAAAVVGSGTAGLRAARVASVQDAARAEGADPADGALPDPYAEGTPVPTAAPGSDTERDPSWCTEDQAMLLLGDPGAGLGHRSQTLRLTNSTDAPCVVEGYPDVAFADQNGHELDVTVEHGGSYLAADPGPTRFELPAGASAVTTLGWGAGGTSDALVTRTLWAASFPGDRRGSWPVDLDVVAGTTVSVTAWSLEPAQPAAS